MRKSGIVLDMQRNSTATRLRVSNSPTGATRTETHRSSPTLAKFAVPGIAQLLHRERLYVELNDPNRKAIWVHGPPGSGKSTLLAGYIAARKIKFAWYQIDEGDNDIATFFHYFRALLAAHNPGGENKLPSYTPGLPQDLPTFARWFFRSLFELLAPLDLLCLDDCHLLTSSDSQNLIRIAIQEAPPGLRLICSGRHPPTARLKRLIANGVLGEVTWQALRLTAEETAALVAATNRSLDPVVLQERTDGWLAGLILQVTYDHTANATGNVGEYLWSEVLSQLSPHTRTMLLELSLLPSLTGAQACELVGSPAATDLLEYLYRHNLFVARADGDDPLYRFHPQFRATLSQTGQREIAPERLRELTLRAAHILERSESTAEAANLLASIDAWPELATLISRCAYGWFAQMRHHTLATIIERLPNAQHDRWISYWLAHSTLTINPSDARANLEQVFYRMLEADDQRGALLAGAAAIESFILEFKSFGPADIWIERLDNLRKQSPAMDDPTVGTVVESWLTLCMQLRYAAHPSLLELIEKLEQRMNRQPIAQIFPCVLALMFRYTMTGNQSRIDELMSILRAPAAVAIPAALTIRCLMFASAAYALQLRLEDARMARERALSLAQVSGYHDHDHQIIITDAYEGLSQNRLDAVARILKRAEARLNASQSFDTAHHEFIRGYWHLFRGEAALACDCARRNLQRLLALHVALPLEQNRLLLAHALFELGQKDEAHREIAQVRAVYSGIGSPFMSYSCEMIAARLHFSVGDLASAKQELATAMAIGSKHGLASVMYLTPHHMATLCANAIEYGIETDYATWLARKRRLACPTTFMHLERWPWHARIYTLGHFDIVVDDEPLRFRGTTPRRPLDLIKLLAAFGRKGVSQQLLLEAFWPASDGDSAYRSLITTIQRARRILRGNETILFADGRVSLNPGMCWVDAWAFEYSLRSDQSATPAARILDLYHGPFLGSDDTPYTIDARERLRGLFLRTVLNIGNTLDRSGDYETAAAHYESALNVESLSEELYRRCMHCLIHLGRTAEAMRVYERCRAVFLHRLGITPSKATDDLLRRLH